MQNKMGKCPKKMVKYNTKLPCTATDFSLFSTFIPAHTHTQRCTVLKIFSKQTSCFNKIVFKYIWLFGKVSPKRVNHYTTEEKNSVLINVNTVIEHNIHLFLKHWLDTVEPAVAQDLILPQGVDVSKFFFFFFPASDGTQAQHIHWLHLPQFTQLSWIPHQLVICSHQWIRV